MANSCCCTLTTVLLLLVLIIIVGCLLMTLTTLDSTPTLPSVETKSVPSVSVLNVSVGQVTPKWEIVIFSVGNTNDHLHLSYDDITAVAYLVYSDEYEEFKELIPSSTSPAVSPFEQHGKEVTDVSARLEAFEMAVDRWSFYGDVAAGKEAFGVVDLNVRLHATVTKPNGRWWSRKSWMTASCGNLKVMFSTKSRKTSMVAADSAQCDVDGKWYRIILGWVGSF